ncbi:MAG: DNA translocase FtsK [Candidatus Omnitrophica bacterium]|nr:DNA translocase FtsK [Candidatus Omnitrophota bacterium]
MKEKRLNEVKGVILVAIGLMLLASLTGFDRLDLPFYTSNPNHPPRNLLGYFGAYIGGILVFLFGMPTSFVLPLLILLLGVKFFRQEPPYLSIPRFIGMFVLLLSVASLWGMSHLKNEFVRFYTAGLLGAVTSNFITAYFSRLGGFIIFITFIILSLALVTEILISSLFIGTANKARDIFAPFFRLPKRRELPIRIKPAPKPVPEAPQKKESLLAAVKDRFKPKPEEATQTPKPKIHEPKPGPQPAQAKARPQEVRIGDYQLPSPDLLDSPPVIEARQMKDDLEANARTLVATLQDFDVSAKVTDILRGPAITRYELEPAPGVKVNRIEALDDDIALAMKAQTVRILAPIPGKARVGVEVPNARTDFVYLKEVLTSQVFQGAKYKLALALGKDITGHPIVADLDEMPHLLIAGTTGSGKTVCVNSLILSLLYKNAPHELKFLMVDPKRVELMPFNGLPHLLCPVVTDAKKVSAALNWVLAEMDERYKLLAKAGSRTIESYNEKNEPIPYIVIIIDEFADLMVVAGDQIENAVTRLAQMARAVGIHLILATQRPSVDVITGVIKANLPARISFKVASGVDARTILDSTKTSEKLLGKGDMLFMQPGESEMIRLQGTLVYDKEIERVVDFIKSQAEPLYNEEIVKEQQKSATAVNGEKDEFYDEAVRVVMESNQASVSILMRRMRLSHVRAARIIDSMEQEGLVGPYEGSKPRKILVNREEWLDRARQVGQSEEQ